MFIELYFAMTSVWLGFFYYLFFFVLAVGVRRTANLQAASRQRLAVLASAFRHSPQTPPAPRHNYRLQALTIVINIEISVLCTYVQLCGEDYNWWWPSFYRGGSVALYVALYSVGFLSSTLKSLTGFLPVRGEALLFAGRGAVSLQASPNRKHGARCGVQRSPQQARSHTLIRRLHPHTNQILVYFSYMSIFISGLYFSMGAVGFLSSGTFVFAIMRAVKAE